VVAERERGAALLTVLLLVAVIAVIAGAALEKLRLSTRLAGNAAAAEQARAYAVAAEALAVIRVGDLLSRSPDRVALLGNWSDRPFALPLPTGSATARVTEGGACFNLNGLVRSVGPGVYATEPIARAQFERLMRALNVPGQVAAQVAGGAADWIDTDDEQQAGGAEDARYTGQSPGYRTAGTLMADPSELRSVAGVTPDLYATLRPWVCTLPVATPVRINVNTVQPEQAPLLAMLGSDTLSVEAVRQALLRRPPQGYANVPAFWSGSSFAGQDVSVAASGSDVKSTWFRLAIDVHVGSATIEEHALIDATRLPVRLVRRQWGEQT
jgi:general secretion pathway protein K